MREKEIKKEDFRKDVKSDKGLKNPLKELLNKKPLKSNKEKENKLYFKNS